VTKQQIEVRVLEVIKCVEEKKFTEDSWLELKREWPFDHAQAARRLAGQANAAQGEPILWIIGLDEKHGVIGAHEEELANWFPQVQKHFDSLSPELAHCLTVPTVRGPVVALLFNTDRAPYLVEIPGTDKREVPWRSANRTRSAFRKELLTLLSTVQSVPSFEALSGRMTASLQGGQATPGAMTFALSLGLYATLELAQNAVIPFHRCSCWLEIPDVITRVPFDTLRLNPPFRERFATYREVFQGTSHPPEPDSLTIGGTDSEVIIYGPGAVRFSAKIESVVPLRQPVREDAEIDLRLGLSTADREVNLKLRLVSQGEKEGHWTWLLPNHEVSF